MTADGSGAAAIPPLRPHVICHMMASIDGRIVTDAWPLSRDAMRTYEQVHASYGADGWLCGRVTMAQGFAASMRPDEEVAREHAGGPRDDFVAPVDHGALAIAADPRGRLRWTSAEIGGDHVVVLLCETVSDEHLAVLRAQGVSYLLVGHAELDLALAVHKLARRFGLKTLMLEGGGAINGAFLAADLIDEISLLIVPVADARSARPSLFDVVSDATHPRALSLESVEQRADGVVWLRYRIARAS